MSYQSFNASTLCTDYRDDPHVNVGLTQDNPYHDSNMDNNININHELKLAQSIIRLEKRGFTKEQIARYCIESRQPNPKLDTPQALANYFMPQLGFKTVEHIGLALVDTNLFAISSSPKILFIGGRQQALVDTRVLFYYALLDLKCTGFAIAHNHLSDPQVIKPSDEDLSLTRQIIECSRILDFNFLDHLIVNQGHYYSIKSNYQYLW